MGIGMIYPNFLPGLRQESVPTPDSDRSHLGVLLSTNTMDSDGVLPPGAALDRKPDERAEVMGVQIAWVIVSSF